MMCHKDFSLRQRHGSKPRQLGSVWGDRAALSGVWWGEDQGDFWGEPLSEDRTKGQRHPNCIRAVSDVGGTLRKIPHPPSGYSQASVGSNLELYEGAMKERARKVWTSFYWNVYRPFPALGGVLIWASIEDSSGRELGEVIDGRHRKKPWRLSELVDRVLSKAGIPKIKGTGVEKYHSVTLFWTDFAPWFGLGRTGCCHQGGLHKRNAPSLWGPSTVSGFLINTVEFCHLDVTKHRPDLSGMVKVHVT